MFRLFAIFLFSAPLFGAGLSVVQDASGTNIPTAYTTAGATVFSDITHQKHLCYKNDTSVGIFLCYESAAAADCENDAYIAPNTGACFDFGSYKALFHKSSGSAISSGYVTARVGN